MTGRTRGARLHEAAARPRRPCTPRCSRSRRERRCGHASGPVSFMFEGRGSSPCEDRSRMIARALQNFPWASPSASSVSPTSANRRSSTRSLSAKAEAANYPFCTIEPNVGVVIGARPAPRGARRGRPRRPDRPDRDRLRRHRRPRPRRVTRAKASATSFWRTSARCDAIVQVARCFDDANVIHVENRVDPVADIATVTTELCLKDLDTVSKRARPRAQDARRRTARSRSSPPRSASALAKHLDDGKPARTLSQLPDNADAAAIVMREMQLLTGEAHVLHRQRRRGVARATSTATSTTRR